MMGNNRSITFMPIEEQGEEEKEKKGMEESDDPHTLIIKEWSDLEPSYPAIVKCVVDNVQSHMQSGYLNILCDDVAH
ncbi:hypothetical protein PM082_010048 [Marasmius tenuissimus]|nr:hypothetical protein PM082_010048 [Marasmius tenuissimus]